MMKQILYLFTAALALSFSVRCSSKNTPAPAAADTTRQPTGVASCKRCIVITDQSVPAIDIVDIGQEGKTVWSWRPAESNIGPAQVKWFSNVDDAKPVYGNKYLLINASGGGVALVRIADKKAVFYAHAGVNPHASELLPDGNIVTASSTDNRLVIFHVDTLEAPDAGYRKVIPLPFAHNVVWDKVRRVLWSAGEGKLYELAYNGDCAHPDLAFRDSVSLPGTEAHDLFPVYGKDSLFLTDPGHAYYLDMKTRALTPVKCYDDKNIKSLSSGPVGWRTLVMIPRESWWSDEVTDTDGQVLFSEQGLRIYKARWFLPNLFSYAEDAAFTQCAP